MSMPQSVRRFSTTVRDILLAAYPAMKQFFGEASGSSPSNDVDAQIATDLKVGCDPGPARRETLSSLKAHQGSLKSNHASTEVAERM